MIELFDFLKMFSGTFLWSILYFDLLHDQEILKSPTKRSAEIIRAYYEQVLIRAVPFSLIVVVLAVLITSLTVYEVTSLGFTLRTMAGLASLSATGVAVVICVPSEMVLAKNATLAVDKQIRLCKRVFNAHCVGILSMSCYLLTLICI